MKELKERKSERKRDEKKDRVKEGEDWKEEWKNYNGIQNDVNEVDGRYEWLKRGKKTKGKEMKRSQNLWEFKERMEKKRKVSHSAKIEDSVHTKKKLD